MRKYIIYDNSNVIYNVADSREEIMAIWNKTKMWRSLEKQIHKDKEYSIGFAELSEEELQQGKIMS